MKAIKSSALKQISIMAAAVGLVIGVAGAASAQGSITLPGSPSITSPPGGRFIPDGPNWPTVTLSESQQGAAGLPDLHPPAPNGFDQESIWNMEVLGFNDNQGRPSSDDGWIENQNGRYILYVTDSGGSHFNPLTGQTEMDGTSLIDVTNPRHPVFVSHIPSTTGSASHLAVCGGNTLPNAQKNHWYMVRHDGTTNQEVWDVTNPEKPSRITVILSGLNNTHHDWWECDTGIAYLIAQSASDGWKSDLHFYIFDLSNPAQPKFIRQFGLPGDQPTSTATVSCSVAPSDDCFESTANPPPGTHQIYSAGTARNRVYVGYSPGNNGVFQILDRNKLLTGCASSSNPSCANSPNQDDLLFPQITYFQLPAIQGAHTAIPVFGVPIPQEQQNYLDGTPQHFDLLLGTSEQTANDCAPQPWKNPQIMDITDERAIWPNSVLAVGQFPGDFCAKGARFGSHELNREIFAPYYGKIVVAAMFNAGLRVWDIRDAYHPREVGYFIQAPNGNTVSTCGTFQGNTNYCRHATFSDLGEVDDRGFIYNIDRAGSGVTILQLTGDAAAVVSGQGNERR